MSVDTSWRGVWDKRRKWQAEAVAKGLVLVRFVGGHVQVAAPFNEEFRQFAASKGRWRHRSGVWTFPDSEKPLVLSKITRIYGPDVIKHV